MFFNILNNYKILGSENLSRFSKRNQEIFKILQNAKAENLNGIQLLSKLQEAGAKVNFDSSIWTGSQYADGSTSANGRCKLFRIKVENVVELWFDYDKEATI